MKSVLAFIECPDHVCYRYRIAAFGSAMAAEGWDLTALPVARGVWSRSVQILAARQASTVIIQRKLFAAAHLRLLRRFACRLLYDVDDAVFQRDSYHRKGPYSRKLLARFRATLAVADAVIVGNEYLKEQVERFAPGTPSYVIPTCVDPSRYMFAQHDATGNRVRLVWIGSSSTLRALKLAEPCLAAVARRLPGIELRLICDRTIEVPGVRVVARPWSAATEAAELAAADIGISWLPDDAYSQGKCGLKVLQYMAAGLPVVASPVGVHPRMIVAERTGLLPSTPDQWAEAVARLAADPTLRHRMGAAGRRRVEDHYSVRRWAPEFVRLLELTRGARSEPRAG